MKRAILSLFLILLGLRQVVGTPVFAQNDPNIGESACKSVGDKHDVCVGCFNDGGVWTAVGCLGQGKQGESGGAISDFVGSFIKLGTGLGGGIAFLLILFSGFQRITSAGNPEKLHEAKDLMTAAISGLLLIIFSIFLLRLIGVDILQIPGFG